MIPEQTEVVVVGAGPVGLAVAIGLVEHGHDVVVIDRLTAGANTSRACVIHPRTLEMLEQLGVTQRLTSAGIHAKQFDIRDGGRTLIPLHFGNLASEYQFVLMVPQQITEQILLDRLESLGGSVHRPYAAVDVTQDASGVEVTLDSGDVLKARYAVAADGMNSKIRDAAGLGFDHRDTLPLNFTLADVRVKDGLPHDIVQLYLSRPGMLVVAPLPDGSFRLVAEIDNPPEHPDLPYAQRLLDLRGPQGTAVPVTEVVWGSRFRIHERVADRYRDRHVLLAGDAAHTHSPAGGQGMNLGLRDAVTLSSALSSALTTGNETKLDDYALTGRAEALRVVALAHRLTRVATVPTLARPLRNAVLRLLSALPAFRRGFAEQLAGIGRR
ncbi:NAD(P)/FAD-dependent oxidoreductase [Kribbella sp. NPDC056861]|uniref:FAD-dependent oxidoreductase n=1 Tax=Kribbella sp. NPDC056861 TaxID=3154857 RepID=UPI00342CA54F